MINEKYLQMSKLLKLIKVLRLIVKKPRLLNIIINEDENFRDTVHKKHGLLNGLPQIDITHLVPNFNETINHYAFLDGGSSPLDIALLKQLAKKYKIKSYLEIGTWRGESVANVAEVVDECYTINLPDEEIYKLLPDSNYIASHRFFSDKLENVTHINSHSQNFDYKSLNKEFDMVFIDGDHHYISVKSDTKSVFEVINPEHSIVVWHDYTFSPESIRWEVLNAILDGMNKDYHKYLYHVSNTNCAVYIPQKLIARTMVKYELPDKKYIINIRTKKI